MNAVGRLGSYISKSVNTVSGPFHPFGGAVDIIVVQQQDGSFKSSPWYVRFGKFQGVLKTKEKAVSINVNGVDADFNMYLDHKGEAFFIREMHVEEADCLLSSSSSGDDTDDQLQNRKPIKSLSWNCDSNFPDSVPQSNISNGTIVARTNSKRSRILGFVFGRRSVKGNRVLEGENGTGVVRAESLERAEIAADLLEMNWSTNFASSKVKRGNSSRSSASDGPKEGSNKDLKKSDGLSNGRSGVNQNIAYSLEGSKAHGKSSPGGSGKNPSSPTSIQNLENSVEETSMEISCSASEYSVETVTLSGSSCESFLGNSVEMEKPCVDKNAVTLISDIAVRNLHVSDSQVVSFQSSNGFHERVDSCIVSTTSSVFDLRSEVQEDILFRKEMGDTQRPGGESALLSILGSEISEEEQLLFGDLDEFTQCEVKTLEFVSPKEEETDLWLSPAENDGGIESFSKYETRSCPDNSRHQDTRMVRSLPNMSSLDNRLANDLGHSLDHSLDSITKRSKSLLPSGVTAPVKSGADDDGQSTLTRQSTEDSKIIEEMNDKQTNSHSDDPSQSINGPSGSSKRLGSIEGSEPAPNSSESSDAENVTKSQNGKDEQKLEPKINALKKKITLTPTSEQLASLDLKEGRNTVTFTFSTSMLGKQQVDARIYLWRWDTRIVISDVDGTITRSDVLGQFMPLMGVDWSHTGVAHLFSAIKENGYQLIFLSARAVSQAYHTRRFLFNLKQDGKTLPDGPVVISPDGLFPSLFREVVRRAPHEFKIACLEEIKALFPADRNPFYAGFGNRDTDEFSYLRVGIPKGKIFIINPKGQIVVNRRIDTKSYNSLHALVDGMFPPVTIFEEEEFNTWNFWKLPPPTISM